MAGMLDSPPLSPPGSPRSPCTHTPVSPCSSYVPSQPNSRFKFDCVDSGAPSVLSPLDQQIDLRMDGRDGHMDGQVEHYSHDPASSIAINRERCQSYVEVARTLVSAKEFEQQARVQIARIKEDGLTTRCRLTEEARSQRLETCSRTVECAIQEKHSTERERQRHKTEAGMMRMQLEAARIHSKSQLHSRSTLILGSIVGVMAYSPLTAMLLILVFFKQIWGITMQQNGTLRHTPLASMMRWSWRHVANRMLFPAAKPPSKSSGESPWSRYLPSSGSEDPPPQPKALTGRKSPSQPGRNGHAYEALTMGPGCGEAERRELHQKLVPYGLELYVDDLAKQGYDIEVIKMLKSDEIDEMLTLVNCKIGHAVKFRTAVKSMR